MRVSFFVDADTLQAMRELPEGVTPEDRFRVSLGEQYRTVDGHRTQMHAIVRELEDQVNEELRK